jgi:hypothetical protein
VRRFSLIIGMVVCGMLVGSARADTFKLNNGDTLVGEAVLGTANDAGLQLRLGEGNYQRVEWGKFSQEDILKFSKTPKLLPLVEPFIEPDLTEKHKAAEVTIKPVERLPRPAKGGLIGAFFGSSLGLLVIFLIYAGSIWAGYEVAIFRAQPPLLVAGLAAIPVLGCVSTVIFLSLPTRLQPVQEDLGAQHAPEGTVAAAALAEAAAEVNPMHVDGAAHPGGLHLAGTAAEPSAPALPPPTIFQRGQFTFNRRFFETKFAGFFGVVRRDAERDMVLLIKCARGQYVGQRISRIAANDLHLQVQKGAASEEVQIPFVEVQEIRIQHRNTPA